MSKTKRIYWFELSEEFFHSKMVKKLRKEKNGDTLALIYLRLLQSTTKSEGIITFDGIEDSVEEELALLFDESSKDIAKVIELLDLYELAEKIDNKKFLLKEAENYIFSESESAKRVRKLRAKRREIRRIKEESLNKCNASVTPMLQECNAKVLHNG